MTKINITENTPIWLYNKVREIVVTYCSTQGIDLDEELLNKRTQEMLIAIEEGVIKIASNDEELAKAMVNEPQKMGNF